MGSKQVGAGLFVLQLPKGEQRLQIGSCHFNPEYPIYRSVRKDQRDGIGDRRMVISGQRIAGDGPVSVIRGRQLRMILICRLKGRIEDTGGTKPAVGKGRGPGTVGGNSHGFDHGGRGTEQKQICIPVRRRSIWVKVTKINAGDIGMYFPPGEILCIK